MPFNPPDPKLESIDGDSYRLTEPYPVEFGDWLADLQFVIPAGTITDLASIPWYLRWINDRASLGLLAPVIHDIICSEQGNLINLQGKEIKVNSFDAAILMLILMRIDGISPTRALLAFLGVILGGPHF